MDAPLRIIHLEDELLDSELAQEQLAESGMAVELDRVDTLPALRAALERGGYSLVLSDYTIPGTDPLEALRLVRQMRPNLPFVFLSGTIGEELATQALKMGANDYVLKQRMEHLAPTVRRALAEARELALRKEAEEALRRSEERLRLAVEVARIGSFEWNLRSGTQVWSSELEMLYGLTPGTFLGTYEAWRNCVHPDDLARAERILHQAMEVGSFEAEWRARWPDSSIHWLSARGHVFKDESGTPWRMVGACIDITERKLSEEALEAAKVSAEYAKGVAEDANRAKDRFLAILSHELRTPLTAVLPALDAMQELVPPAAVEFLDMASRNVELEARLIDDLLDITRIARGKVELQRKAVDLCAALQSAADVCKGGIESRGLHFRLLIEDAPHIVDADPARLQQIFWNLIQNAVKFTPPNGCIGVRARRVNGQSIVEVCDSGVGIESDALGRVFNAFEQEAKSITRQFGGLGLGLAICKALAEMHGGSIRAGSDGRGKGAIFATEFPIIESAVGQEKKDTPAAQVEVPQKVEHLRILLVEDHVDTGRIITQLLRKAGHEVRRATDLASAKAVVDSESFDMLVSDLGLPDGSGHDLMRHIVASGRRLPAIALSGYGMAADIERSHEAGFLEHIVKPVSFPTLLAAVGRVGAIAMRERNRESSGLAQS